MSAPVWSALEIGGSDGFCGRWQDRRWMNTPGPFYAGAVDCALVGTNWAPEMIGLDAEMVDVVFRQPMTMAEVVRMRQAAAADAFEGYGCDGNRYWTRAEVVDWWARRNEIVQHIEANLLNPEWWPHESERSLVFRVGVEWKEFLAMRALGYLREFVYFLEGGKWPVANERLPEV